MIVWIVGLTLVLVNFSALPQARAATITVLNNNDSGAGSLRQIIGSAGSSDIIVFASSLSGSTITLTTGQIPINKNLTIDGSSLSLPITISGNGASRIFNIGVYTVTLDSLVLDDGYVSGSPAEGGAIYNSGSLTLRNGTFTKNHTDGGQSKGGAIYNGNTLDIQQCTFDGNRATSNWSNGGAIFNAGTLTVTSSTFSNNTAASDFPSYGGAIYNSGSLTVTDSVFSGNSADDYGGAIYIDTGYSATFANCILKNNHAGIGGGIMNYGTLTMTDCTIGENNTVHVMGGGINNSLDGTATLTRCTITGNSGTGSMGGAGINNDGKMTLTNCTISGNVTNVDGGGIRSSGILTLINCTITNNTADADGDNWGSGGGICGWGKTQVRNTIIAGNADLTPTGGFGICPDVQGSFTSQGYNLVGKSDGSTGFTNGVNNDIVGTIASPIDPRLAPLANNGGPTKTHALFWDSPALDAIPEGGTGYNGAPSTDQRGVARPQPPGGNCDMGAFEGVVYPSLSPAKNPAKPPSLLPLASTNISMAESLLTQAGDLLSDAKAKNLDAATCERLIEEAKADIAEAKMRKASPITANYFALQAIKKLNQAVDCLEALLG